MEEYEDRRESRTSARDPRSRWGRTRFGVRGVPAMGLAIPVGILLAAGFGVLAVGAGVAGTRPLLGGIVFACAALGPFVGLAWILVVDRSTLRGATERPEDSVEQSWYTSAASSSFTDIVTVAGVSLAIIAVAGVEVSAMWTLSGLLAVAALSFSLRYFFARRAG